MFSSVLLLGPNCIISGQHKCISVPSSQTLVVFGLIWKCLVLNSWWGVLESHTLSLMPAALMNVGLCVTTPLGLLADSLNLRADVWVGAGLPGWGQVGASRWARVGSGRGVSVTGRIAKLDKKFNGITIFLQIVGGVLVILGVFVALLEPFREKLFGQEEPEGTASSAVGVSFCFLWRHQSSRLCIRIDFRPRVRVLGFGIRGRFISLFILCSQSE